MDLVYIVSADPLHDHIELQYSLRSAQKHLIGFDKLVIVGHCPAFIKPDIYIEMENIHGPNIARNIYEKILAAASDFNVSLEYVCMSEDYFLLKDFNVTTIPYFFDSDLQTIYDKLHLKNYYRRYVENTLNALTSRQLPILNFNVHAPILYNKIQFKRVMADYDWEIKKGYIVKSLYCNTLGIPGQYAKDVKFHTPKDTMRGIMRKIGDSGFFSTNEHSINPAMKETFQVLYPVKSKWEK